MQLCKAKVLAQGQCTPSSCAFFNDLFHLQLSPPVGSIYSFSNCGATRTPPIAIFTVTGRINGPSKVGETERETPLLQRQHLRQVCCSRSHSSQKRRQAEVVLHSAPHPFFVSVFSIAPNTAEKAHIVNAPSGGSQRFGATPEGHCLRDSAVRNCNTPTGCASLHHCLSKNQGTNAMGYHQAPVQLAACHSAVEVESFGTQLSHTHTLSRCFHETLETEVFKIIIVYMSACTNMHEQTATKGILKPGLLPP